MKLLYLALPLLGSLAIAQSLVEDECQCPQVKCPDTNTFEGCRCVNLAELRCKKRCPNYTSTKFRICPLPQQPSTGPPAKPTQPSLPPILGFPVPALPVPAPSPSDVLPDLPLTPGCECEEMMCIQSYPNSCHCAYGIAKKCYDKCGGPSPGLNTCPPLGSIGSPFDGPVKRAADPEPQKQPGPQKRPVPIPVNVPASIPVKSPAPVAASSGANSPKCKCEERMCIQSWPEGCRCSNAVKNACWKKCGGPKPALAPCLSPVGPIPKPPTESRKHQVCGGGRAGSLDCPTGSFCMNDPFKSGCGLECDGTGICVKEEMCGGFAGFRCPGKEQVCVDRPGDSCDPNEGGADCAGVCVWPSAMRTV